MISSDLEKIIVEWCTLVKCWPHVLAIEMVLLSDICLLTPELTLAMVSTGQRWSVRRRNEESPQDLYYRGFKA